jgi:hypothetical protein
VTRFNPLNEYGRVEIEVHAFLVWTVELQETSHSLLAVLKRLVLKMAYNLHLLRRLRHSEAVLGLL